MFYAVLLVAVSWPSEIRREPVPGGCKQTGRSAVGAASAAIRLLTPQTHIAAEAAPTIFAASSADAPIKIKNGLI